MDRLGGYFGAHETDDHLEDDYDAAGGLSDGPPSVIGQDERRMQVRAYNLWASLLGDRALPLVTDLDHSAAADFGPYSVLLDLTNGVDGAELAFLGRELAAECGGSSAIRLADVPARSVLSRITDHYLQVIANQAPIGFEAQFVTEHDAEVLYRGILLPFSSDGSAIDFVYGVINWRDLADEDTADELLLEIDQVLAGDHSLLPEDAAAETGENGEEVSETATSPLGLLVESAYEAATKHDNIHDLELSPMTDSASRYDMPRPAFGEEDEDDGAVRDYNPLASAVRPNRSVDALGNPIGMPVSDTPGWDDGESESPSYDRGIKTAADYGLPDWDEEDDEDEDVEGLVDPLSHEDGEDAGTSSLMSIVSRGMKHKKAIDLSAGESDAADDFGASAYQPRALSSYSADDAAAGAYASPYDAGAADTGAATGFGATAHGETTDYAPIYAEGSEEEEFEDEGETASSAYASLHATGSGDYGAAYEDEDEDASAYAPLYAEDSEEEAFGDDESDEDEDGDPAAYAAALNALVAGDDDDDEAEVDGADGDADAVYDLAEERGSGAEIVPETDADIEADTDADVAESEVAEDDVYALSVDEVAYALDEDDADDFGEDGDATAPDGLYDALASARVLAQAALTNEDRSRKTLYSAVSQAYDFSLEATVDPQGYQELIAENGLTMQDRAPMTPIVKLVFGADYDKTRLTEYAAVLTHAHRMQVERGGLATFLRRAEGGLKGVVHAERRLRREEQGKQVEETAGVRDALARKLRVLEGVDLADIAEGEGEFALVMVRRLRNGALVVLGAVPEDIPLIEKAARKLLG